MNDWEATANKEAERTSPSVLRSITIKDLYIFLWKLAAATILFGLPLLLVALLISKL